MKKICEHCGHCFETKHKAQRFCNRQCSNSSRTLTFNCKVCNRKYQRRKKTQQFCSPDCALKARRRKQKVCPICQKKFQPDKAKQVFCSRVCTTKSRQPAPKVCIVCHSHFIPGHKKQIYCNKDCMYSRGDWKYNSIFSDYDRNSAYILGLILTDGNLIRRKSGVIGFYIGITDLDVMKKVQQIMTPMKPLYENTATKNGKVYKPLYYVYSFNDYDTQFLIDHGCEPDKTFNVWLPTDLPYQSHLIRGIFDGDGCVSIARKGTHRLVVTFKSASSALAYGLQRWLLERDINAKIYPRPSKSKQHHVLYDIRIGIQTDILRFRDLIYQDQPEIFMYRKKRIFFDNIYQDGRSQGNESGDTKVF